MRGDWEDLLTTPEQINSRRKQRNNPLIIKKVNNGDEQKWLDIGYSYHNKKSNSRSTYLEYKKKQDELFEDKVWVCFSKLGFNIMNSNDNFRIRYSKTRKYNNY